MEEPIIDYLKYMMTTKKCFEKIMINYKLYKYECMINTNNGINIYTTNKSLDISHINDKKFLKLFMKCIKYKYKNDDDLIQIYDDMFYFRHIPKKINTMFGELIKKYIKCDEKELEQTNTEISEEIEKFITKIIVFDKKIKKISSRYEFHHDNILFNMCLGSIHDNIYIMEFIIFGKKIISIIDFE